MNGNDSHDAAYTNKASHKNQKIDLPVACKGHGDEDSEQRFHGHFQCQYKKHLAKLRDVNVAKLRHMQAFPLNRRRGVNNIQKQTFRINKLRNLNEIHKYIRLRILRIKQFSQVRA